MVMYTDGSCLKNPDGPGGYGTIIHYENNGKVCEKRFSKGYPQTTNNRMEISAVIRGFEELPESEKKVRVYTDSQYVVNTFQKGWIMKWQRCGWKKGVQGDSVKNSDLWQHLLDVMKPYDVTFVWVKGHAGNPYNELCDQMAVTAAKTQEEGYFQGLKKDLENTSGNAKSGGKQLKFTTEKVDESDFDQSTIMEDPKAYYIVPIASYNQKTASGKWKCLLVYNGFHTVICGEETDAKSANDLCLHAILMACKKIRYSKKKIVVFCGTVLGFANPKKSSNRDLLEQIQLQIKQQENVIVIKEIHNGMKKLKQLYTNYATENT